MRNRKLQERLEGIAKVGLILKNKKTKHAIEEKSCVYAIQTNQKWEEAGLPWWSSGQDPALPVRGAGVWEFTCSN